MPCHSHDIAVTMSPHFYGSAGGVLLVAERLDALFSGGSLCELSHWFSVQVAFCLSSKLSPADMQDPREVFKHILTHLNKELHPYLWNLHM